MTSMCPTAAPVTAAGPRHSKLARLAARLLATTALVAVADSALIRSAPAATIVWNGTVSTDWTTGGNWSSNSVPTAADAAMVADTSINNAVIGTGVSTTAAQIVVSTAAAGALTISGGGLLTSDFANVSLGAAGGAVLVTGAGSSWVNTATLVVGAFGTGDLKVLSGGSVQTGFGSVGLNSGSAGSVLVNGAGSQWQTSHDLHVGLLGQGNFTVSGSGAATVGGIAYIGSNAGASGSLVVTGAGSTLGVTSGIIAGYRTTGDFKVLAGSTVSSLYGSIGDNATGVGTATVDGAGSSWLTTGAFDIGILGQGTLTVSNAGSVSTVASFIGFQATGNGALIVTGPNSQFNTTTSMEVGRNGRGSLTVADAGTVSAAGITVAVNAGSTGAVNIGAAAGAPAAAPGSINAPSIVFGLGTGSLNFNHTADAYTFGTKLISGGGTAAINQWSGTTILTADNSGFLGTTTVVGGKLVVNNALGGAVNVNGGMLSGTGSISAPNINTGGTFAPGNGTPGSSMTLTSLAFQSGAYYLVSVDPATSSFAKVAGTAMLGGATVNAVFANGSYVAKQYTILTAGSVSGTFDPTVVNSNLPKGFKTSLSYDATHAYLDLAIGFTPPGAGLNVNQQNVGNAITNFFNTNGSIPLVFGSLLPAGLTQLSGETATGAQQATFNAMTQFMGVMTDPFVAGRGDAIGAVGGPTAYADESVARAQPHPAGAREAYAAIGVDTRPMATPFEQRWSVWASGFGGSQTTDGNAAVGSNGTTSRMYGTAVGADYRFSPNTLAGFALAGGGTNFSVVNGGNGRSDLFQAGAYVRHVNGPAYITAALAYGWQDVTTDRTVMVAGIDRLRSQFNANAYSGRIEGGYRFVTQGIGLTPYAAGQFTTFDLPAYAEAVVSGLGTFALAYNAKTVTATRSELGLRSDKSFAMSDGVLTLRSRVAWAHDFNPDRSVAATFQTLPGASFVVNGAAQAANSALLTAAAEKKWLNGWSAAATFEGEFSNVTRSYAGKGVVRYAW